jgi:hypothetical protein
MPDTDTCYLRAQAGRCVGVIKSACLAAEDIGVALCGGYAFEQTFKTCRFQRLGGVFKQVSIEVSHGEHIVFVTAVAQTGGEIVQRCGLCSAQLIPAALAKINIPAGGA